MVISQVKASPPMSPAQTFVGSSIGKKIFMAVTGTVLTLFVFGHMLGNLQIFIGQNQLNTYAVKLHELGPILWIIRLLMATFALVHIFYGIRLWLEDRHARPESYKFKDTVQATLASRTMIYTGVGILLYVIYHLLHFTLIVTNPEYAGLTDPQGRYDVYSMVILGFQNYLISAVYIVAMAFLCYHLSHGVESVFQTLGLNSDRFRKCLRRVSLVVSWILFIGYVSIPLAVLAGCITLPGGGH